MSGIWSAFACCFPRKRTRHDDGEGSETNSLLAHSVNGPSAADNNTSNNQNAGGQNTTSNKAGSVVSYEVPPAGASTVGYGAVGQGHAVLGEEGRLRVQSIASAVENRMISINHPSQTNYNSQQYSQSRRPTPSKQDQPGNTTRADPSSPASMAAEDHPSEAPPVIHLPPSTAAPDNDPASPARVGGDGNGRPDLGRSRSSTSSSVSQANSGHLAQIEGVRRVNLNLGGMWERERERGRKEKKSGGSIGGGSGAGGMKKGSSASVKSGQAGVKKDDQEDKKKEVEVVAMPPTPSKTTSTTTTSQPTEPKLDVNVEPEPAASQLPVETTNKTPVAPSEPTTISAPKPNEQESSKPERSEIPAQTDLDVTKTKADEDSPADAVVAGADAEGDADADADAGAGAGGASATGNSGGGGKSGRGKKKKNRGRGRGKGGKGGR